MPRVGFEPTVSVLKLTWSCPRLRPSGPLWPDVTTFNVLVLWIIVLICVKWVLAFSATFNRNPLKRFRAKTRDRTEPIKKCPHFMQITLSRKTSGRTELSVFFKDSLWSGQLRQPLFVGVWYVPWLQSGGAFQNVCFCAIKCDYFEKKAVGVFVWRKVVVWGDREFHRRVATTSVNISANNCGAFDSH